MKTLFFSWLLLLTIVENPSLAQNALSFEPSKPKAGDKIIVRYNPSLTPLLGISEFEGFAYLMEGSMPLVQEIRLTKEGKHYKGEIKTNDTTKAVFVTFSKDEIRDNNNDAGYYIMLVDPEGNPVQGARMSIAQGMGYGGIWGLKRNHEVYVKWMKEEFQKYPGSKEKFRSDYLSLLGQSKDDADREELLEELEILIAKPDIKESDLSQVRYYYEHIVKDKEKASSIANLLKEKFPNGLWLKAEKSDSLYNEQDPAKKEAIYKELIMQFPPKNMQDEHSYDYIVYSIANGYSTRQNFTKLNEYTAKIKNKNLLARLYNSVAWKLAGEGIAGTPGDVRLGKDLSWKSLQMMQAEINSAEDKPPYYTEKQWKKQQEQTYYAYADTYALLLYHSKDYENAYKYEKRVVENYKRMDVGFNEAYSLYLEKAKGSKAVQPELENFIREGNASPVMKEQLRKIYHAQKKPEEKWDSYLAELEKAIKEKRKREIVKKMINEPAPPFQLKDLEGTEVSLASLRGKVVIVDFWATWCGPCIASFPGMIKVIEKYKDDPEVKFVFVDTWESGETDKIKNNVAQFIKKNAYPFHVLMDYDSKVVQQYNVEGIPTKFVIDKNNNIRFRDAGFSGNPDEMVDELALMIELSKK